MGEKDKEKNTLSEEIKKDLVVRIVLLSIAILYIAAMGIAAICSVSKTVDASDCKKENIVFKNYTITDSELWLYPEEGEYYKIVDYAAYITDIDEIKKLCEEKKRFTVYSRHYVSDVGEPGNTIYELSYKDKTFFSFEDVKAQNRKLIIFAVCVFSGSILIFVLIMIGSVVVVRNPDKHYFLAKILFRKSSPYFLSVRINNSLTVIPFRSGSFLSV